MPISRRRVTQPKQIPASSDIPNTNKPKKPSLQKTKMQNRTTIKTPTLKRAAQMQQSTTGLTAQTPTQAPLPEKKSTAPAPRQHMMTTTECFIYGGVVCLVGTIGFGLLLGLVVLPPIISKFEQSQYSYAAPLDAFSPTELQSPAVSAQTDENIENPEYGFYGTLLSREENVLMIQELLQPLPLEGQSSQTQKQARTFAVRVNDETEYTHQRPRDEKNLTDPLFSPESGALEELNAAMYVFVSSQEDPENTDTINANHILYSEKSPFAE